MQCFDGWTSKKAKGKADNLQRVSSSRNFDTWWLQISEQGCMDATRKSHCKVSYLPHGKPPCTCKSLLGLYLLLIHGVAKVPQTRSMLRCFSDEVEGMQVRWLPSRMCNNIHTWWAQNSKSQLTAVFGFGECLWEPIMDLQPRSGVTQLMFVQECVISSGTLDSLMKMLMLIFGRNCLTFLGASLRGLFPFNMCRGMRRLAHLLIWMIGPDIGMMLLIRLLDMLNMVVPVMRSTGWWVSEHPWTSSRSTAALAHLHIAAGTQLETCALCSGWWWCSLFPYTSSQNQLPVAFCLCNKLDLVTQQRTWYYTMVFHALEPTFPTCTCRLSLINDKNASRNSWNLEWKATEQIHL